MPIRKRLTVLTLAGGVSGLFSIPLVLTARPAANQMYVWLGLPLGSLLVCWLCGWAGLRFADRANLAMPYLRPWEIGKPGDARERGWLIRVSIATGGIFGLVGTVAAYAMGAPVNPSAMALRLATFPFSAVVAEIVAHLFVMSGLVLLMKRTWLPVLLSAFVFVAVFHLGQFVTRPMTTFDWGFDYLFGVLTGWIYSRYGIEGSTLANAVSNAILIGLH